MEGQAAKNRQSSHSVCTCRPELLLHGLLSFLASLPWVLHNKLLHCTREQSKHMSFKMIPAFLPLTTGNMMLRVLFCFGITQLSEDYQKISESFHLKILLASSRHFWLHTENRKQRNTFYCSGLLSKYALIRH